ncbi:hypothetical protein, partial [Streptococcus pseudopneumoniae]|uniref:hypothetical protein n=1 Tax=Streptococcus pseudopneumoniae TaxID=257758 RepID=UPI0018B0C450
AMIDSLIMDTLDSNERLAQGVYSDDAPKMRNSLFKNVGIVQQSFKGLLLSVCQWNINYVNCAANSGFNMGSQSLVN